MSPATMSQHDKPPTPDEVMEWVEEQAFKSRLIKWRTYIPPEEVVKDISMNLDWTETYRERTVGDVMTERVQEYEREQWIIQKMRKHGDIVKQTEAMVEQKLLTAGMSVQELKQLKSKKASLRVKVAELHKLQHPAPKEPQRVKVSLLWQTETDTKIRDYYLSAEETLDSLKPTLSRSCATVNAQGEHVPNRGTGPWMYQLTEKSAKGVPGTGGSHAAEHPRVALLQEIDYRELMRTMTKKGSTTPSAVIFQESTITFQKELAKKKVEEDLLWNILDEDGRPVFQEVDWENVVAKEFFSSGRAQFPTADQLRGRSEACGPRRSARLKSTTPQLPQR